MPNQDKVMDALRPFAIPPGDYMTPRPSSREDMRSPAFAEKMKKGPVMVLTMMQNGPMAMGKTFVLWFLYTASSACSLHTWQGAHCPWARPIFAFSSSPAPRRSSDTRSPSGRCRSGIAAPGVRPSRPRLTG
jgi:hypothetical protein